MMRGVDLQSIDEHVVIPVAELELAYFGEGNAFDLAVAEHSFLQVETRVVRIIGDDSSIKHFVVIKGKEIPFQLAALTLSMALHSLSVTSLCLQALLLFSTLSIYN